MSSAQEIWLNLEKRFALTSGSRKYKLNKELYELKQHSLSVREYYTLLKSIWEELDSLNLSPNVISTLPEVTELHETIVERKEKSRLFRFLNGLEDHVNAQMSQILLMSPLPTVESACASLEQEEAQRDLLNLFKPTNEMMAMYNKN